MEKTTLGIIQLVIGVLLLILGIIGIIYSIGIFDQIREMAMTGEDYTPETLQIKYFSLSNTFNFAYHTVSLSVLLILFSFLFITQGGINSIKK